MDDDEENPSENKQKKVSLNEDPVIIGTASDPDPEDISLASSDSNRPRFSVVFDAFSSFFARVSEPEIHQKGIRDTSNVFSNINWISKNMACMFVIGNSMGSFVFELPHALRGAGWFGVFLIILCIVNTAYSGIIQAKCWILMEEQWPDYKKNIHRSPIPEMGYRVGGRWMKYIMSFLLIINQVTVIIIKLFILAKFIDRAIKSVIPFCSSLIIITVVFIPFSLLGTPKDYKSLAIVATVTSSLAVLFLCISVIIDKKIVGKVTYRDMKDMKTVAMSMGTIIVAVNPGMVFPTIQQDMESRASFPKTVFTAHLVILYLFLFFPILGYAAYGDGTPYDVIYKLKSRKNLNGLVLAIEILLSCEMFASLVFQLNPVTLHLEDLLQIPENYTYKRFLLRTGIVVIILLITLSASFLTPFMPVFRSLFTDVTSYVLPGVLYIALFYKTQTTKNKIAKKEWFFILEMSVFGIVALIGSYLTADYHMRVKKQFGYNCYSTDHFLHYNFTIHE